MPPKMLTRTARHVFITQQNAECFGHLLDIGATPDVQEVRWLSAVQFNQIHCAHRQPRAVDKTTDISIQLDVAQPGLCCPDFGRFFFGKVTQLGDIGMAEQRVVIEAHFGIESQQLTGIGDDERIDLRQAAVVPDECATKTPHEAVAPT